MAYPFPRSGGSPETPQHLKGMDSSRSKIHRNEINSAPRFMRSAFLVIVAIATLILIFSTFSKRSSRQLDGIPSPKDQFLDYFSHYEGHQDCGITSLELYVPPKILGTNGEKLYPYCKNRATLLKAMSGGGRHGFDTPFFPKSCHYRWYSTAEICMILNRFDAIVFIGDNMLRQIYTAFNILLRENVALGGLKQWEMSETERSACRCENQFVKSECLKFGIARSDDVMKNDRGSGHPSPYYCGRTPHVYLPITDSPALASHAVLNSLLSKNPDSYKPIPIIHSLSLATSLSWPSATASIDEWLGLADAVARNTPFLWLGPVAAGHLKPPSQIMSQGNNALWHFTVEMAKEAHVRDIEHLEMYNLTLQAKSWDGSMYGEKVGLVQAMMVRVSSMLRDHQLVVKTRVILSKSSWPAEQIRLEQS
ncbi:MAG: hypothetical protein M1827_005041 [Pycnora praestabilis]|nr:MAG: hypothetical protein M1827_005041 [Pycnora praestabilis]